MQKTFKTIIGYIYTKTNSPCDNSVKWEQDKRILQRPIVYWIDQNEEIQEIRIGTETGGRFEIDVPKWLDRIYVQNEGFEPEEIMLNDKKFFLVHLKKEKFLYN